MPMAILIGAHYRATILQKVGSHDPIFSSDYSSAHFLGQPNWMCERQFLTRFRHFLRIGWKYNMFYTILQNKRRRWLGALPPPTIFER